MLLQKTLLIVSGEKRGYHFYLCFSYFIFLQQILGSHKTERKVQIFPLKPLTTHMHSFLSQQRHSPEQYIYIFYRDEPTLIHHYPSSEFILHFMFGIVQSKGLDKCIMTHIYHSNIIQGIFFTPKIFCVPLIHLSPFIPQQHIMWSLFYLPPVYLWGGKVYYG